MDKLKKRITYEIIIICTCITIFTLYIMGLAIPNIYFSNFLLSTIQVILVGAILMFILQLYFHDLKMVDEFRIESENKTNTNKPFWSYCIIVSGLISTMSMVSYFTLSVLVFILNLRSLYLNIITIIIITITAISLVTMFTIIIIRYIIKNTSKKRFKK